MTVAEYIAAGLRMGAAVSQAEIDRAEGEVIVAYVLPIIGTLPTPMPADVKEAIMNLAYTLLLQRNIVLSRSGDKVKDSASSRTPDSEQVLAQRAHVCHLYISGLRKREGANSGAKVNDICCLYFESNFFNV